MVLDWLKDILNFIIDLVLSPVSSVFDSVLSAFPELYLDVQSISNYAGVANKFVALDYGFSLLVVWFGIVAAIILINWILGLIPWIN